MTERTRRASSLHLALALAGVGLGLSLLTLTGCAVETSSWEEESVGQVTQELVSSGVSFRTPSGRYMGAVNNGGGDVVATATVAQAWEKFSLDDINGGSLQSGDAVFLRAGNGQYFMAQDGGGSTLTAGSNNRLGWETFFVVKKSGGGSVQNGDVVGLQTQNGHWVSALGGGGDEVDAHGLSLRGWEEFTISGLAGGSQDPECSGVRNGDACCASSCGSCGGSGCGSRPGGSAACCSGPILSSGVYCSGSEPPCIVGEAPVNNSPVASLFPEWQFNQLFPNRNSFYTYQGFLDAAAIYPAFAGTGDTATRKREIAAFLANVTHETGDLRYVEEINKGNYCSSSSSCPCASGKRYFGRGPIQLSWNYNYCAASQNIFGDKNVLRTDPDRVARESWLAWATAMWFWMTQTGAGSMTGHDAIVDNRGFGETIRTINGSLECNGGNPGTVQTRINYYYEITNLFNISAGGNLYC